MRRSALLVLILILSAFFPALGGAQPSASPSPSVAGTTGTPAKEQVSPADGHGNLKPKSSALQRLQREQGAAEPTAENPFLEGVAIAAFGLLILCALLATGTLLIGLRQRKVLLKLEAQMGELQEALGGLKRRLENPSSRAQKLTATDERSAGDRQSLNPSSSSTSARMPGERASSPASALSADGPVGLAGDGEGGSALIEQHQAIYDLLDRLRREAPRLGAKFADSTLRERFQGELDAPVRARMERLRTFAAQGEEAIRQQWLGPDLIATLDSLARFYSAAVEEERRGQANGLALELRNWLYDYFGSACQSEGWFGIDPVEPYRTAFDPKVHHAVAGRDADGAAQGRVVALRAIGRRDAKTGALLQKAEVIVGR